MTCSCGNPEPHVTQSRRTADGKLICRWSDGGLTRGHVGTVIKGARTLPEEVADLVIGEIELYDRAELPQLVKTAKAACKANYPWPLVYLRNRMAGRQLKTWKQGQGRGWRWE